MNEGYYPQRWKLIQLQADNRPKGLKSWLHFLWGYDLWLGPVPAVKTMLALDVIAIVVLV